MEFLPFEFDGATPLRGEVRFPEHGRDLVPIVLLPDFLLFRGWGFYPFLAERLARRFYTVTFDPSLSGFGVGEAFDAGTFKRYSLSSELGDVATILERIATRRLPGAERCAAAFGAPAAAAPARVGLVGHTKGAALACVFAQENKSVRAIACLSAICTINRFSDADRERLMRDGELPIREPVRGGEVVVGRPFLDDLRVNPHRFELERIVRELEVPMLFVHGEEDGAAGIEEAETLFHWADKRRSRLVVLEKTGHTFGAQHPFTGPTPDLERVASVVLSFLEATLIASDAPPAKEEVAG